MQVLEDGRLTDGQGRTVDFKNTVLIFTSNLGTSDISKAVGLGFTQGGGDNNYERMKQKVNDELKKHFRPEFLNRIDDIIVFHQLTRDEIIQMVDLMVGRVGKQLKTKDMAMELTDKAKALLAKRGFDPVLGARPLRRTIQREIEDAAVGEDPLRGGRPGSWSRSTSRTGTARAPARTRSSPSPEAASRRPSPTWPRPARTARAALRTVSNHNRSTDQALARPSRGDARASLCRRSSRRRPPSGSADNTDRCCRRANGIW